MTNIRSRTAFLMVSMLVAFCLAVPVSAQYAKNATAKVKSTATSRSQGTPTLKATLVDAQKNAMDKSATVTVNVAGVKLIDPALTDKKPRKDQGHLHYQVDDGPVIATTTPKLSFHGLTPGKHKIVVMLATNDHSPLGPQDTLEITIP